MNTKNNRLRTWTEQRTIHIPQLFFQFYKELNIEDDEALIVLHLLAFHVEGNDFPTPTDLMNRLTMPSNEITSRLQRLMQKASLRLLVTLIKQLASCTKNIRCILFGNVSCRL